MKFFIGVFILYLTTHFYGFIKVSTMNENKFKEELQNLKHLMGSPNSASGKVFLSPQAQNLMLTGNYGADLVEFYVKSHPLCDEAEVPFFTNRKFVRLWKNYIDKWYVCSQVQKLFITTSDYKEFAAELVLTTESDKLIAEVRNYAMQHGLELHD